jgi:hypothetical protein
MNKRIIFLSLVLAISMLLIQVGGVAAAHTSQSFPSITGVVQSITIETDPSTGIVTVVVDLIDKDQNSQSIRISEKAAEKLGLIVPDSDGNPMINKSTLGQAVEIRLSAMIRNQEENQHPIGSALATFFSGIGDNETLYKTIMEAHNSGFGFGVIAQALWLTKELKGDVNLFNSLLTAKQEGDYSNFSFDENGIPVTPKTWSELKKAIIAGNLGAVISNQANANHDNHGNDNANSNNKDHSNSKDKDKNNNGNGNNNGNANGNSNGNGNGGGNGNNNGNGNGK